VIWKGGIMNNIEYDSAKDNFIKAGYNNEEADILAEEAIKYKSTIANVSTSEAVEYIKQIMILSSIPNNNIIDTK
jgi:hypothetical protein